MKFLKGLALSLLSLLLFLSLAVFGLVLTLNYTILNPDFVVSQIDKLDISSLAEEVIIQEIPEEEFPEELRIALIDTITKFEPLVKEQVSAATYSIFDYLLGKRQSPDLAVTLGNTFLNSNFVVSLIDELDLASLAEVILSEQMGEEAFPEEFGTALVSTITELEPLIKQRIGAATYPIFDYLLGKSQSLDLALTLGDTILNPDFVASLVDELDMSLLMGGFVSEQITERLPVEELPEGISAVLDDAVNETIIELEPWMKEQATLAAGPIFDYLLGESQGFKVVISLEPVKESLSGNLREAFVESLPLLAVLPPAVIDELIYEQLSEQIPPTFELNESLLGTEIPAQIAEALAGAEEGLEQVRQGITEAIAEAEYGLEQARQYIGYFQLGYKGLIGFILLLILGIIFINRQVRGATRGLGVIFLTYGAFEYAGIFAAKYFAGSQLAQFPVPSQLQAWIPQLLNDFLAPLQMFSLGLLAAGVVLLVVSFAYKPRQPSV